MSKQKIKTKNDSELKFAIAYAASLPATYSYKIKENLENLKSTTESLINKYGMKKAPALILAVGGIPIFGAFDKSPENYGFFINIYKKFIKNGNNPIQSAFLTTSRLRHSSFIGTMEDAEKEYTLLEKMVENLDN